VRSRSVPITFTRGKAIFKVVDGVTGTLSNRTLARRLASGLDIDKRIHGTCRGRATYTPGLGRSVDELLAEVVPVLVPGSLLDDNLLVVVRELEDDVLVLLGELQVTVGGYAILRNGGTAVFKRSAVESISACCEAASRPIIVAGMGEDSVEKDGACECMGKRRGMGS
jgi:hypothetical protein